MLAGGTFSDCSALSCQRQLYALLAPLCPPHCPACLPPASALCTTGSFAPSSLPCLPPAFRQPFWLSDSLLVTGTLLDAQHLAPRCPPTHSASSSLPDILVITWPSLATLSHPGYSEPFGALLVTRRLPICPSPLACRNPQWPSWPLLALLVFGLACIMHIPH